MKIGVVGATGLVGRTIIRVLEEQSFRISELHLFATQKSAGTDVLFQNKPHIVSVLTQETLAKHSPPGQPFDYLFFSAGSACALTFAPIAAKAGSVVIDNSPAFRGSPLIPLVIPEINQSLLLGYTGIIANPNCAVIQMLKAVYPIHRSLGIEQMVVTTFQSLSGAGQRGLSDPTFFRKPIQDNVIPVIGDIGCDGFSEEENKIASESRKILNDPDLTVYPTAVRVPVKVGHSESIMLKTKMPCELSQILPLYRFVPSCTLAPDNFTPLEAAGSDQTFVSRLRMAGPKHLMMWVSADNVRVGAATNAVNIMKAHMANRS